MKIKFIVLILVVASVFSKFTNANAQINVQDSAALVDLYNSTNGPGWRDHTNWLTSAPVSTWNGIVTDNNRVTQLQLSGNNLSGIIPSSLGNIINLTNLFLDENKLSGTIPYSLGNLISLVNINLGVNNLTGKIPSSLGKLTNLKVLELYDNQLSGNISQTLGNLVNLYYLVLVSNNLTGSISFLSKLDKLEDVELSFNKFSSSIPVFRKCINLTYLVLNNNLLSGNIRHQFDSLINLPSLVLQNNQLTGQLPYYLNKLTNLVAIDVSNNQLSGTIPNLSSLKNLQYFNISHNNLSGTIPYSLCNLTNLNVLDLSTNLLKDTIPASIANLSNLYELNLDANQFTFESLEKVATAFPFAIYSPQAVIHINQNGNKLSVSAGGTLTNNTYEWHKNRPVYKTKTGDSTLTVNASAAYVAKVTNSFATQLTLYSDTLYYTAPFAINSIIKNDALTNNLSQLSLYPNPVKDILWVKTKGINKLRIINTDGKEIYAINTSGNFSINVKAFANGTYYLQNETTKEAYKIVVTR